jgi:hypothetical protein
MDNSILRKHPFIGFHYLDSPHNFVKHQIITMLMTFMGRKKRGSPHGDDLDSD